MEFGYDTKLGNPPTNRVGLRTNGGHEIYIAHIVLPIFNVVGKCTTGVVGISVVSMSHFKIIFYNILFYNEREQDA